MTAWRDGEQYCLWLYSPVSGGTGKTFLMSRIMEYVESIGGTAKRLTELAGTYLDPFDFKNHLVVLEDVRWRDVSPTVLNNLIDRNEMSFNIKGGAKSTFTSSAVLGVTSNERPDRNVRRFAVVEYASYNVQHRKFDLDAYKAAVRDAFETCPSFDEDELASFKTGPGNLDIDACWFIVKNADKGVKMRASEFVFGNDGDKDMLNKIEAMFTDWKSKREHPDKKWGSTPFRCRTFDWHQIALHIKDKGWLKDSDMKFASVEDECAAKWDDMIYRLCGPAPEGPSDDAVKRPDEGCNAEESEPSGRADGRPGARPAVYDRL